MTTRPARPILLAALLAAALGGCGGDDTAQAAPNDGGATPQVYTSEVESVSRWIEQSGAGGDSMELTAAKNPRGEGVVVYARKKGASDTAAPAAWMVVDSQVVPLNQASRKATPKLQPEADERTWTRIGITRPRADEDADLRDVVPPDPPARETPKREPRQAPQPPETAAPRPPPGWEPMDSTELPAPRTGGPADTLRIPAGPPARNPASPRPAQPAPRDTVHVPAARPGDTTRGPGTGTPPAAPHAHPEPDSASSSSAPAALPV